MLTVGPATILARIIAALELPEIAISANGDPARFAAFGRTILGDGEFAGHGPLAGILAGLEWAASIGASALLSVPGDTPFIPGGLAAALWPPPACAASHGRVHHLVALWPATARFPLRAHLSRAGSRRVADFSATILMRRVDFPTATWDSFHNVNTPSDLEAARNWAGRITSDDRELG